MSSFTRLGRMRMLGEFKPVFHVGGVPGEKQEGEYRQILPVSRPWPLIIILALFTGVFTIPLFTAFSMQPENTDSLFELVFLLFTLFWMLAWSAGVLTMLAFLCSLLFAREVLIIRRDTLILRLEFFGFGAGATYLKRYISNLTVSSTSEGGNSWRGNHLEFLYFDVPVALGSQLDVQEQMTLVRRINRAFDGGVPQTVHELPAEAAPATESTRGESDEQVKADFAEAEPAGQQVRSSSSLMLVLANLVPVAGVLFLGWKIGDLMLLFWLESAIIGLFNAIKMFFVGRWSALFYVPFFVGHFGGFMAVHLIFVFALFVNPQYGEDLASVAAVFLALWPAILSLFVSHGYSFLVNFIGRKEYSGRSVKQQMSEPYKRIIVMHLTILLGGFLVMVFSNSLAPLVLLIGLKLVVDLYAHHHEHRDDGKEPALKGV